MFFNIKNGKGEFQSTLPARGATVDGQAAERTEEISIHAPREGSDQEREPRKKRLRNFNPRSPRGERLDFDELTQFLWEISIHAPREGSDVGSVIIVIVTQHFNPRSPRGERRSNLALFHRS